MLATFKIREVAIPNGFRRLLRGETVKAGDFVFFEWGTPEDDQPIWHQLKNEPIVGVKMTLRQTKDNQGNWIIRKIE